VAKQLPKPAAILCISAHWETRGTFVTVAQKPRTIHDFGGFPKELFEVQYPAPGNPSLAKEIKAGMKNTSVDLDEKWGLDHGCWSVVKHLYPKADVPVLQMSLDYYKTPAEHYAIARELAWLRKKGILIIGSGNMVHNLGMVAWDKLDTAGFGYDWALEASDKMKNAIINRDHQTLMNYKSQGKSMNLAIPTPDHFLPLLYILALQDKNENTSIFNDKPVAGSLTMTSVMVNSI
jgi:4,5-DOPA dioxygenase extradiol